MRLKGDARSESCSRIQEPSTPLRVCGKPRICSVAIYPGRFDASRMEHQFDRRRFNRFSGKMKETKKYTVLIFLSGRK